jgi:hypothetical protein
MEGYKIPTLLAQKGQAKNNYVKYYPENQKKSKSYINMVIAHAKGIPDPRKYSKIIKWATD